MKNDSKEDLKKVIKDVKNNSPTIEYGYGPLNKSKETRLFESIVSAAISDRVQEAAKQYDTIRNDPSETNKKRQYINEDTPKVDPEYKQKVSFSVENNKLWVEMHDPKSEKINITELIKKVNLNHVSLPESDVKKYEELYENNKKMNPKVLSKEEFTKRIQNADLSQQEYLPQLSHGEMLSIYSYSSENYKDINGLLRGTAVPKDPVKVLMDTAISSQGLNKIPTIELPVVTRYQDEYGLDQIKEMAKKNEVQEVSAFISTAFEAQKGFGHVQIVYENVRGVSISALSKFPEEKEYLIPPTTQIKFTGYKLKNGKHIFSAEGVNVLLDPEKARAEIDTKINELSNKFKDTRQMSNKDLADFMIDSAKIAHKYELINDNILNKYVDTFKESTKEGEKVGTFKNLGVKDRLVLAVSNVADKIGLKSLSTKLENKLSPEGKKTIEMKKKMSRLFENARNIVQQAKNLTSLAQSTNTPPVVKKNNEKSRWPGM